MDTKTIRAGRLDEAKRAFNGISEFANEAPGPWGGSGNPRYKGNRDLHAIAGALIVIAEQGEERNELHWRTVEGAEKASARAAEQGRQMIEAALGRAVGDDEGFRNEIKPAIQLKIEHDRAYDLGFQDGERAERSKIDRNREMGFSRGFEAAKAMFKPASGATKELIDAALAIVEPDGRIRFEPGHLHARLFSAAKAYRQLMNNTPEPEFDWAEMRRLGQ
jgi:hypothetical protein